MTQVLDHVRAAVQTQLLAGGLIVLASGLVARRLAALPSQLAAGLASRLAVSVEIWNDNPLFDYFAAWLAAQPCGRSARRLTAVMAHSLEDPDDGPTRAVVITPAPGHLLLRFRGRRLWVERIREASSDAPPRWSRAKPFPTTGPPREAFVVRMFHRDARLLRDVLDEVARFADEADRGKLGVFVHGCGAWRRVGGRSPRRLATITLPDGVIPRLLDDVRRFLAAREWYAERGVPHRRGYLLHGPPGTGKSSLVEAIVGECGLPIYIVPLGGTMTDDELHDLISDVPPRSVLLLEDIDAIAPGRATDAGRVTLSGLLNVIDGVRAAEGVLVFMTTNHPERLDPALVRPGRVDVRLEFGHVRAADVERAFVRFYGGWEGGARVAAFARRCEERKWTMAQVQQAFLASPHDPDEAIGAATEIDRCVVGR